MGRDEVVAQLEKDVGKVVEVIVRNDEHDNGVGIGQMMNAGMGAQMNHYVLVGHERKYAGTATSDFFGFSFDINDVEIIENAYSVIRPGKEDAVDPLSCETSRTNVPNLWEARDK